MLASGLAVVFPEGNHISSLEHRCSLRTAICPSLRRSVAKSVVFLLLGLLASGVFAFLAFQLLVFLVACSFCLFFDILA